MLLPRENGSTFLLIYLALIPPMRIFCMVSTSTSLEISVLDVLLQGEILTQVVNLMDYALK